MTRRARSGRSARGRCADRCSSPGSRDGTTPPTRVVRGRSGSPSTATRTRARAHRPGGALRLPGPPAAGRSWSTASPGRSTWPENAFFTVRARRARPRRAARRRAVATGGSRSAARCSTSARETGCEMVVTFGALLADVPHTRKVRVTGTSTDADLIDRLGLARVALRGADRASSACSTTRAAAASVPSVSLWAPVPHYIAVAAQPAGDARPPRTVRPRSCELELDLDRLERDGRPRGASRSTRSPAADDDIPATSSRSRSATTQESTTRTTPVGRRTSRPATRSPPSSSASSATSAATAERQR